MSDVASSQSSEVWSSSESNDESSIAIPPVRTRPRHGVKKAYKAPKGYIPALQPEHILTSFGSESLASDSNKELWCIKIPDGISPAQLDGLTVDLPEGHERTGGALAQIEIDRQGRKAGSSTFKQHYTLQLRSNEHWNRSRVQSTGPTQLIAMAGVDRSLHGWRMGEEASGNDEMHNFLALLPDATRPGRYVRAAIPLKHHMQLILKQPSPGARAYSQSAGDQSSKGDRATAGTKSESLHPQPWSKLKGFFSPSGFLTDDDKKPEFVADSSPKKQKRSNKDKISNVSPKSPKKSRNSEKQ